MSTILDEIFQKKRERVAVLRRDRTWADLEASELWSAGRRSLARALERQNPEDPGDPVRFLCEIKRASPSAGWIRPGADAVTIGKIYAGAGAGAISLLTEEDYFKGDPEDLPRVRAIGLPVLMKDFFVDPYQVGLARSLGADALLLIAALDDRPLLREMRVAARELGIEVLLEVHDEWECEVAHDLLPELAGVNNRDLRTFEVDLSTSERLLDRLPAVTRIAESGIRTREEVVRLERARFDGLLIGESLMREADPGAALCTLRGVCPGEGPIGCAPSVRNHPDGSPDDSGSGGSSRRNGGRGYGGHDDSGQGDGRRGDGGRRDGGRGDQDRSGGGRGDEDRR